MSKAERNMAAQVYAFCTNAELTLDQCNDLQEFVKEVVCPVTEVAVAVKARKKRKPSAYNIFMGECVKDRPEGQRVQDAFKACAVKYKEEKKKKGS